MSESHFAVRRCAYGKARLGIPGKSQATNQFVEQLRRMARALCITKRNGGQLWNEIHLPQPFLDHIIVFALQYDCNTFKLSFAHSG